MLEAVIAAVVLGTPYLLVGAVTALGQRRRTGDRRIVLLAWVFWPIAWIVWYVHDRRPTAV